jgi:septum formation protein
MPTLVLASGSPRRKQFLTELGYAFQVVPADIDESRLPDEKPLDHALRLARTKATTVARPDAVTLAADTIVVLGDVVLGKPVDVADFQRMMQLLSGRAHSVLTAVAVRAASGELQHVAVETRVTFAPLSAAQISWYWSTGEPRDKAGGYALQGKAGAFVTAIEGSHSNVIGLPLVETVRLLDAAGLPPPWTAP